MPPTPTDFAAQLANPMGYYYLFSSAANFTAAGMAWKQKYRVKSLVWMLIAVGFGLLGTTAFRGFPLQLTDGMKTALDAVCTPAVLTFASFATLSLLFLARVFFVKPPVAWGVFNGAILYFGASLTDPNFFAAVMRPDDIPIVAMVFLLGFFLWLAMYQAVQNDRRLSPFAHCPLEEGPGPNPVEKDYSKKCWFGPTWSIPN